MKTHIASPSPPSTENDWTHGNLSHLFQQPRAVPDVLRITERLAEFAARYDALKREAPNAADQTSAPTSLPNETFYGFTPTPEPPPAPPVVTIPRYRYRFLHGDNAAPFSSRSNFGRFSPTEPSESVDQNRRPPSERLLLPPATTPTSATAPHHSREEDTMAPQNDAVLKAIEDLRTKLDTLGQRQDQLANDFNNQRTAFNTYLTSQPPMLPMGGMPGGMPPPPALPPAASTAMQLAAPNQFGMVNQPFIPNVFPTTPPLVRRDIKTLALIDGRGLQVGFAALEVITTTDPTTNEEKTETIQRLHRNKHGEVVDHNRPYFACYSCGELTNHIYRCTVCDVPMCAHHVYAASKLPAEGQPKAIRCCMHTSM